MAEYIYRDCIITTKHREEWVAAILIRGAGRTEDPGYARATLAEGEALCLQRAKDAVDSILDRFKDAKP